DPPFLIVVHASNHKNWVKKNLDSLFAQSYNNFRVIYIDDASSDGTQECVEDYIRINSLKERLIFIKHEQPKGLIACLAETVQNYPPDTIVMPLKGCDWLAHRNVLSAIRNIYADASTWLTYGQYSIYPNYSCGNASPISEEIVKNNEYRNKLAYFPALKTFYAGLFQRILSEELLAMPFSSSDYALFIPLLEMAGRHSKYIPDIHYIYNSSQCEITSEGIASIPNVIENLDLRPSQSPGIGRSNLAPISNSGDDSIAPIAGAFASVLNQ